MPQRKNKTRSLKGLKLHSMLERIDNFGRPMPAFNVKGRTTVHSMTGGILTFMVAIVVLTYGAIKVLQLANKENPNVSEVYELDYYNFDEEVSLKDVDFRIAFSIENYL